MTLLNKAFCLIAALLISQTSYALDSPGRTLTLTLINQSQKSTLNFVSANPQHPNITFAISPRTLLPKGGSAVIIAKVNCHEDSHKLCSDLSGMIYFKDNDGNDNTLVILDRIQAHAGQPIFAMNNARLSSQIADKVMNHSGKPNELSVMAAWVEVRDK